MTPSLDTTGSPDAAPLSPSRSQARKAALRARDKNVSR